MSSTKSKDRPKGGGYPAYLNAKIGKAHFKRLFILAFEILHEREASYVTRDEVLATSKELYGHPAAVATGYYRKSYMDLIETKAEDPIEYFFLAHMCEYSNDTIELGQKYYGLKLKPIPGREEK